MSAATAAPLEARSDRKPSTRQVYYICRLALRFAGHELPDNRKDASELIQTLSEALTQRSGDDCPF
jgi:hypothetical protein